MHNFLRTGLSVIFLIGGICSWSFLPPAQYEPSKYLFAAEFKKLKISKTLLIKRETEEDHLAINLDKCKPEFYLGVSGVRNYYLEDAKKINKIGVTEYVFKDAVSASRAFENIYRYAEYTRKLPRADYDTLCHAMWDDQVYYATKHGLHIILYNMNYNFMFYNGTQSVETNMQNDTRILLDDIYLQMKGVQ